MIFFQSLFKPSPYLDALAENLDPDDFDHSDNVTAIVGTGPSSVVRLKLQTKLDRSGFFLCLMHFW